MLILGHRGAILGQGNFYQNSLGAFDEALRAGDGFETDACLDSNGEIFLIHEAKYVDAARGVEYCAGEHLDSASMELLGQRRIDQLTTDEMQHLRLRDGSKLPTLREALVKTGQAPGKLIDIELKAYNVVRPVLQLADEMIRAGKITDDALMLSSFNHLALKVVRQQTPKLRVGAIFVGPDQASTTLFPWQAGSTGSYTAFTPAALEEGVLKEMQPDYFVVPEEILTRQTVDLVTAAYPEARLMAWVFTEKNNFDLPDLIGRLIMLHATGKIAAMMVDNPHQFASSLPLALRG
jgi:glycerophosphoryl diester phosphodiesterase